MFPKITKLAFDPDTYQSFLLCKRNYDDHYSGQIIVEIFFYKSLFDRIHNLLPLDIRPH